MQKYFDAGTTLQEEQQLREYFRGEITDPDLEVYRPFFEEIPAGDDDLRDLTLEREIMEFIGKAETRPGGRYRQMWITVAGIAASLLVVFLGMQQYQQQQQGFRDTFSDPGEALAYATQTLQYVSGKYNQGLQPLEQSFKAVGKGWMVIGDRKPETGNRRPETGPPHEMVIGDQ